MEASSDLFGNVLDVDMSVASTSFEYEFEQPEVNQFGTILETDLSQHHVIEDPLIKNFEGHHHILTHDMTRKRIRFALRFKHFFAWIFGTRPKRASLPHHPKKRIKKRRLN